jgi:hypothetical protein
VTDVALREYLERRIDDLERRMLDRFLLNDQALTKSETRMTDRLHSMNEFREAMKDQTNRMATRMELEKVDESVRELQRAKANLDGRLFVLSGVISASVTILLWALSRLVP